MSGAVIAFPRPSTLALQTMLLRRWRTVPPIAPSTDRLAVAECLARTRLSGVTQWDKAVAGDAATAIGVAIAVAHEQSKHARRIDIAMSALWLAATRDAAALAAFEMLYRCRGRLP